YWARLVHPEPSFSLTFRVPAIILPGDLLLPTRRLVILAFAVVAIALFHLFLKHTKLGKEARALSQDYEGALVVGVNPRAVSMAIFTLGIAVTALCGAFFVLTVPLNPYDGIRLTLVAMIIVVLGGVGSLPLSLPCCYNTFRSPSCVCIPWVCLWQPWPLCWSRPSLPCCWPIRSSACVGRTLRWSPSG